MSNRVRMGCLFTFLAVAFFGPIGLIVWITWPTPEPGQECFEQLHVGMAEKDAEPILEKHGFIKVWSGIDDKFGAEVMRYTLDDTGNPAITVVYSVNDRRMTEKDHFYRPEPGFFETFMHRLIGH